MDSRLKMITEWKGVMRWIVQGWAWVRIIQTAEHVCIGETVDDEMCASAYDPLISVKCRFVLGKAFLQ